jgi:hypothetical protein
MPSKSKKQQRLMGMAYSHAIGNNPNPSDEVKDIVKSFTKKGKKRGIKKLKDFASTKHKGLKENQVYKFNKFCETILNE